MTANKNIVTLRRLAAAAASVTALAAAGSATAIPVSPILNLPPRASFTVSPTTAVLGETVSVNAAASVDLDGTITRYEWDFNNDGVYEIRSSTVPRAGAPFSTPGIKTVRLRVTDDDGARSTTTRTVTIHRRPVALLSADRAVPNVGDVVGYRATGSYDPDGDPIVYFWDLDGNGSFERYTGTNPFIQTSFPTPGMQRIAVKVRDARGADSLPTTLNVRVNKRPTAVVSATPNPAVVNASVALSGASSTDDRGIVKYEWDLDGNGTYETNTGASPQTSTMFSTLGQVKVGLQVTDTDGAVDQSTATITVNPAPVQDTTKPFVRISPASVRMREGFATFKVTCPVTEMSCATTLTLRGRFGSLRGKVLGRASETVPGGETLDVFVPLNSRAITAVRRKGSVKAQAIAVAKDAAGNVGTTKKFVKIRK